MTILGPALRAELADAVGVHLLKQELRSLAREVEKLRALIKTIGQTKTQAAPSGRNQHATPPISGTQIRALRDRLGESRKAFAARLRVSPSIIFMWESGRSAPRRAAIVARLQQLVGSTEGTAAATSTVPVRPSSTRPVRAKRNVKLSPQRRAALKLQGQYMGFVRRLKPKQKVDVKAIKASKGFPAAIALARKLAAA